MTNIGGGNSSDGGVSLDRVRDHFDSLALSYDTIKKKNDFYHETLKRILRETVPAGKRVLEIGTGTGEMLNTLRPSRGIGIDASPRMIAIAKRKHPHLEFSDTPYENFESNQAFDYIVLADVIEHLASAQMLFQKLKHLSSANTQIVLTMANPLWEPVLHVLEQLKLKMDEGPHNRISRKELVRYAADSGFKLRSLKKHVLLPVQIPLISHLFNNVIAPLPGINRLALIEVLVFSL